MCAFYLLIYQYLKKYQIDFEVGLYMMYED